MTATIQLPFLQPTRLDAVVTCESHIRHAFDVHTMQKVCLWGAAAVKELQADAILACGHSGLTTAGAVSLLTGIPVFAFRKPGEENVYSCNQVTGVSLQGRAKRWVWWDDFISEGNTFRRCRDIARHEGLIEDPYPVAALAYARNNSQERAHGSFEIVCTDGNYSYDEVMWEIGMENTDYTKAPWENAIKDRLLMEYGIWMNR